MFDRKSKMTRTDVFYLTAGCPSHVNHTMKHSVCEGDFFIHESVHFLADEIAIWSVYDRMMKMVM